MEALVEKIREAEALARRIKESEERVRDLRRARAADNAGRKEENQHEIPEIPEQGDWLNAFRSGLGRIGRPLVVLSLFDGIGGTWAALDRLDIPYKGYSSEINPHAIRVVKANYPDVTHLGNVRDIRRGDIVEDIDLIVGGFPCQDLTSMGKRDGVHGSRSRLFFDMLRILYVFQPKWFLAENVASMSWVDREEISKYLRCIPIEIDSQDLTATRRQRLYWTNIPLPNRLPDVKNHRSSLLQHYLHEATALEDKIGCVLSHNYHNSGFGQLQRVFDRKKASLRCIHVTELEQVLGFPLGHTDVDYDNVNETCTMERICELDSKVNEKDRIKNIRWKLLGNTFSVPVISYLLSPLLDSLTWETHVVYKYSPKFNERECTVMEPGDVWALYNTRSHPSWYAIVQARSGDRFAASQCKSKKKTLELQVFFLELDSEYLDVEDDSWSPFRGTGVYNKTDTHDVQSSWITFSHKMTTFKRLENGYFFYPGQNEIWAVFDVNRATLFYVFVVSTEFDWDSLGTQKAGRENFAAHCKLMQRTSVLDVFRCTDDKLVLKNLAQFSFRVPYYYKGEANMFKLEASKKIKYYKRDEEERQPKEKRKLRKRARKASSEEEEEDDEDDDDDDDDDDAEDDESEEKQPKERRTLRKRTRKRSSDDDDDDAGDEELEVKQPKERRKLRKRMPKRTSNEDDEDAEDDEVEERQPKERRKLRKRTTSDDDEDEDEGDDDKEFDDDDYVPRRKTKP